MFVRNFRFFGELGFVFICVDYCWERFFVFLGAYFWFGFVMGRSCFFMG